MKHKLLIILLICSLLTACTSQKSQSTDSDKKFDFEIIDKNHNYYIDVNAISINYTPNGLNMDENTAYVIGNAVLESAFSKAACEEREHCEIYELKDENIYVITRNHGGRYIGGDIYVAIDKNTGETIKVWFGE